MIYDDIIEAKKHDQDKMIELIKKFKPLLKKYSRLLYYEDAYQELVLFLFESILYFNEERMLDRSDGSMISYIKTSIHNQYLLLLKRKILKRKETCYCDLTEEQIYSLDEITATNDIEDVFLELDLIKATI